MGLRLAVMRVSPWTRRPLQSVATRRDVGNVDGKILAADRQDLAADADSLGEIAGDVSESGEKEVAEIVADEPAARVESILEEAAEESFVLAERDHAIANVARRQDAIFAAEAAGTAAVIGNGDNRSEAGDGMVVADFCRGGERRGL